MPRPKSFIVTLQVDSVSRAHNCQNNNHHRLNKGDKRLKVSNGRSYDHYCTECAKNFVKRDIEKLNALLNELS